MTQANEIRVEMIVGGRRALVPQNLVAKVLKKQQLVAEVQRLQEAGAAAHEITAIAKKFPKIPPVIQFL